MSTKGVCVNCKTGKYIKMRCNKIREFDAQISSLCINCKSKCSKCREYNFDEITIYYCPHCNKTGEVICIKCYEKKK